MKGDYMCNVLIERVLTLSLFFDNLLSPKDYDSTPSIMAPIIISMQPSAE